MKKLAAGILLSIIFLTVNGQKLITRNGYVGFFSHTAIEDIKADNNQAAGVIDTSTGEIAFQVLIKAFHFEKALMEEHFNENYMESDKFPKSAFKGKITNLPTLSLSKKGTYEIVVEGDLTIHGVTNRIAVTGTLGVSESGINANSKFTVIPEDYNIKIPGIVRENISKNLEVSVKMNFGPAGNN